MQVVLESPSALERQFTITIPNGDVETEFEAKLAETAKRVRVDGFRPGKSLQALHANAMDKQLSGNGL